MKSIEKHLRDLEKIYAIAMTNDNFTIALKAKELLAKTHGLFNQKSKPKLDLKNYTEQELLKLLKDVEEELGGTMVNESLTPKGPIHS